MGVGAQFFPLITKTKISILVSLAVGLVLFLPASFASAAETRAPEVKIYDSAGSLQKSFLAYSRLYGGGVTAAVGNILGDERTEIVTVSGKGGRTHIRSFSVSGRFNGVSIFPFHPNYSGEADLTLGDVDGDGKDEIIVSQGSDGDSRIKVYKPDGYVVREFLAFSPEFKGGVYIAAGDINGDGRDEIVAGAGAGGNPHVRVFDGYGRYLGLDFFPLPADFRGGVDVAIGDIDHDGRGEIITGAASLGSARVKVYEPNEGQTIICDFLAYDDSHQDGVRVSAADVDDDGAAEIVAAVSSNAAPEVKAFETDGRTVRFSETVFEQDFRGGVTVAGGDVDGDGRDEILAGPRRFIWEGRRDLYKYIEIDLTHNRLYVYENGRKKFEAITSDGRPGMPTPTGEYKILSKEVRHWSGKYGLWMPYSMKFHPGGFYIHRLPEWPGGYVEGENHLGMDVSHGCVRVGYDEAKPLYDMSDIGEPVIIHYSQKSKERIDRLRCVYDSIKE